VFRCTAFPAHDGQGTEYILDADPAVRCYEGEHARVSTAALVLVVLYCVGIPSFLFLSLWRRRGALFDARAPGHAETVAALGGLYLQFDHEYWYFQMLDMLMKCFMTGAMCIVSPGTPMQLAIGTLCLLFWLLLVLKTAPFLKDSEDRSSFASSLALTLTSFAGFALIMDDPVAPTFPAASIAVVLIVVNALCLAFQLTVTVGPSGACWRRNGAGKGKGASAGTQQRGVRVLPAGGAESDLRQWKTPTDGGRE
jgi:hypothetical protein